MAGKGAPPRATHQRARDTRARIDAKAIKVPDKPFDGPTPDLPEGDWHPQTLRWWETWATSPQAHMFTSTDWAFLSETAYLADAYYRGNLTVASELRLRVAKWGATPEDRARLRLQLVPEDEESPSLAVVTPMPRRGAVRDLSDLSEVS
ncbi:hypothetical protein SAMN05421505_112139 [Sinosporangium album]|uniref:Terminase small subunit n=1 Tax=Sinosporangium album TaxID=504805 RepID=A0A1G8AFG0_9ACTN|nr:hypothetical protein [Sinosporangium album]SDH19755.1 hypothetical protein SAMN05421505_112139 [Sinosporangium album]